MAGDLAPRLTRRASEFGLTLSRFELTQFEAYFRLLDRWNVRINLTGLPLRPLGDHAVDRLFLEPLIAAQHTTDSAITWFDLGSGGGSPAIPLKILRPQLTLTMVESVGKKAAFLREAVRVLSLADVSVEHNRFEDLMSVVGREHIAQLVTARAVREDAALLKAAWSLLLPTGSLRIFRSTAAPRRASALFQPLMRIPLVGQAVLDVLSPVDHPQNPGSL